MSKKVLLIAVLVLIAATGAFAQLNFWLSAGGGVHNINDWGGGVRYNTPAQEYQLNYSGYGIFGFFDAGYADLSAGFFFSPDRIYGFDFGLLGRYPFNFFNDRLSLYPHLGVNYRYFLRGEGPYPADGNFNALWINTGGGFDYLINDSLFIRGTALYGVRLKNSYETNLASDLNGRALLGHGPTFRISVGYRLTEVNLFGRAAERRAAAAGEDIVYDHVRYEETVTYTETFIPDPNDINAMMAELARVEAERDEAVRLAELARREAAVAEAARAEAAIRAEIAGGNNVAADALLSELTRAIAERDEAIRQADLARRYVAVADAAIAELTQVEIERTIAARQAELARRGETVNVDAIMAELLRVEAERDEAIMQAQLARRNTANADAAIAELARAEAERDDALRQAEMARRAAAAAEAARLEADIRAQIAGHEASTDAMINELARAEAERDEALRQAEMARRLAAAAEAAMDRAEAERNEAVRQAELARRGNPVVDDMLDELARTEAELARVEAERNDAVRQAENARAEAAAAELARAEAALRAELARRDAANTGTMHSDLARAEAERDEALRQAEAARRAAAAAEAARADATARADAARLEAARQESLSAGTQAMQSRGIEVIPGLPNPATNIIYNLQVGAFNSRDSAARVEAQLRAAGFTTRQEPIGSLVRVLAVNIPAAEVSGAIQRLGAMGFNQIWVRSR